MNNLCRLAHVKRDIAGVSAMANTTDTVLGILQAIDDVSREFESECGGRSFAATVKTLCTQRHPRACRDELWLPEDVATISSLTVDDDADGTYELTLVENIDYWVEREIDGDSNTPIVKLVLNPDAATVQLYSWPTRYRAVKLTCLAGYSYEVESAGTLGGAISDTTGTSVTMTAGHSVEPGDTLKIDSEQFEVTAVATNTLTVTRGINGTTAATHANGATVSRRRYPRRVEQAVKERVVGLRWDTQSGYAGMASLTGDPAGAAGNTQIRASYARWRRTVEAFKRWGVA